MLDFDQTREFKHKRGINKSYYDIIPVLHSIEHEVYVGFESSKQMDR